MSWGQKRPLEERRTLGWAGGVRQPLWTLVSPEEKGEQLEKEDRQREVSIRTLECTNSFSPWHSRKASLFLSG